MKTLFTLLIGIIVIINANAQTPQQKWAKSFNGNSASTDTTSIIKMYALDKSIYIAGTSDAYGNANDIVLIKRDYSTGDTLWTRHYNGPANSDDQAVDMVINQTNGDVFVTGKSMGISTGYDIATLKYSSSGVLVWAKRWDNDGYNAYHGDDIPKNIDIDVNGRVIITATTYQDDFDLLVIRYDNAGILSQNTTNLYANASFVNSDDFAGGARVNNLGQVFMAGEFGMGDITNGWSGVYIYGLSSDYAFSELYTRGCTGRDYGFPTYCIFMEASSLSKPDDFTFFNAIDLDNSNNVYLAYFADTISGVGSGYTLGIAKINSTGCTIWRKKTGKYSSYNNLRINAIKVDPSGNVYAAGYEKNGSGNFDWFVIKYNSSGVFQWRVNKDGSGNGNDIAYNIAFDQFQNPIVAGNTRNTSGNDDISFIKFNKTNGSELFSVNYDSGNEDDKAYNIIVDASQKIIINGIQSTPSQSQNMITLLYCNPAGTAGTISGISSVCQGQNAVTYTVPEIENATSYIWTLPGGATGTSTTNSITINFGTSAISGDLTVKGHNDCNDGAISSLAITVYPLPENAGIIGGSTNVCQSQNSVAYTVPVITNATSYIWSLPTGATGTSATNSINVNYGSSASSGNITVKGNNACGNGIISSLPITVNPLPSSAGTISGTSNVCQGQNSVSYTVPAISNATSYVWILPTGATGTSTTNNIIVDFSNSAVSGNISVKGINPCGEGALSTLAITVNSLPETAGSISGLTTVCQSQSVVIYSVPIIANASSYIWSLPIGAVGTSSSNSITIDYGISAVSGNITVSGHNMCGVGELSTSAIVVNPKPSTPIITQNGTMLHSDAINGNQWYNQNDLIDGATNQNYYLTSNGVYYVIVTLQDCSSDPSNTINYETTGIEQNELSREIKIYPNPVTYELVIEIMGNTKNLKFEILNSLGQVVFKGDIIEKAVIQTTYFSPGIYLIKLENGKTFEFKKVIKN